MKPIKPNLSRAVSLRSIDFGMDDGKFDNIDRYFLDTGLVDQIYNGKKSILIGRKGTGKTAIAHYVKLQAELAWDKFATILSFKDVPVVMLEQFHDKEHKLSNKYVLLWKYIFLVEMAKLLLKDQSLAGDEIKKLETFINLNFPVLKRSPREYLKETIERKFKLKLEVLEAEQKTTSEDGVINLLSFTNDLQQTVRALASRTNKYLVFIDELDDIYEDNDEYYNIIVGMFKAGMDLNAFFRQDHKQARVVMLLRDDIYRNVQYADKNKWSDMTAHLEWIPEPKQTAFETNLFKLINLRIGASLVGEAKPDEDYWDEVFSRQNVKADIRAFQYILSRSYYRPRDIIQFCKQAKEKAIADNQKFIDRRAILDAEFAYSKWFLEEVKDELRAKIPTINDVFEAVRRTQSDKFTTAQIDYQLKALKVTTKYSTSTVLSILFEFSVIGMFTSEHAPTPMFKFREPHVEFEENKKYSVHFGLRPALRLA